MQRIPGRLLFGALIAAPLLAFAQQNGVRVENAWSRAAAQGRTGVVYATITVNAPDRLTGAASPVAARAELHESFTEGGVSKMRPVAGLPIEPGKPLTLAPGGYHLMLLELNRPLKQGEQFPLALSFEKAGQVQTVVTVQRTGGGMPMGDGTGMPMHQNGMPARPQ